MLAVGAIVASTSSGEVQEKGHDHNPKDEEME